MYLGHQKAIVNVIHHPEKQIVLSASQDSTVRVWNYENEENLMEKNAPFNRMMSSQKQSMRGQILPVASAGTFP